MSYKKNLKKKKKKKTSVNVDLIQKYSVNFYYYKELKKLTEREGLILVNPKREGEIYLKN